MLSHYYPEEKYIKVEYPVKNLVIALFAFSAYYLILTILINALAFACALACLNPHPAPLITH